MKTFIDNALFGFLCGFPLGLVFMVNASIAGVGETEAYIIGIASHLACATLMGWANYYGDKRED